MIKFDILKINLWIFVDHRFFKTHQTFNNLIIITVFPSAQSSEILYIYTFFKFSENIWSLNGLQTFCNDGINESLGCIKKIREILFSWDEKEFKSLMFRDVFRPKVGLFFSFFEKSLKNLFKKSMKIFVSQFIVANANSLLFYYFELFCCSNTFFFKFYNVRSCTVWIK